MLENILAELSTIFQIEKFEIITNDNFYKLFSTKQYAIMEYPYEN